MCPIFLTRVGGRGVKYLPLVGLCILYHTYSFMFILNPCIYYFAPLMCGSIGRENFVCESCVVVVVLTLQNYWDDQAKTLEIVGFGQHHLNIFCSQKVLPCSFPLWMPMRLGLTWTNKVTIFNLKIFKIFEIFTKFGSLSKYANTKTQNKKFHFHAHFSRTILFYFCSIFQQVFLYVRSFLIWKTTKKKLPWMGLISNTKIYNYSAVTRNIKMPPKKK